MSNMKKPVQRKRTFAVSADEGIFELNVPIDITNPKYKNMLGSVKKPTLHSTGGLLIDPKFKKTPKERKQEKAFGAEPTDLGIPMMGLISMGMTAASGSAYDKAQKLNKKYKRDKKAKKLTATEGSFQTGGLIKGKPKLAKRGWK